MAKNQIQKLNPMPFHYETEIKDRGNNDGSRMDEDVYSTADKKLRVIENSLSHSRSLKVIQNDTLQQSIVNLY